MCRTKLILSCCCAMLVVANTAFAVTPERRQCLQQVRDTHKACTDVCKAEKIDGKEACGLNPECHKACNTDREACSEIYDESKEACIDACHGTFDAAKEACKASLGCQGACYTNPDFLACIRGPGAARYNCAADCRDGQRLNAEIQAAIKACNVSARACHKSCRILPTPRPM